jgi:hypothetical protein
MLDGRLTPQDFWGHITVARQRLVSQDAVCWEQGEDWALFDRVEVGTLEDGKDRPAFWVTFHGLAGAALAGGAGV